MIRTDGTSGTGHVSEITRRVETWLDVYAPICRTILLLLSLLLAAASARAQETTGILEGRIVDTEGKPVIGANIAVRSEGLQGTRGISTDSHGRFTLIALPVGVYSVRISHVSFGDLLLDGVKARLGKTTTIGEIILSPRTVEMPEVTVLTERPLIDPASTELGGSLAPELFARLPVQRSYDRIITLLPQINESYLGDGVTIAGSTGMENRYFIDGVDVTDPYRGLNGASLPTNIIKDIEVKSGGYEAEYRSTLGGIINVVTSSGSNDLSGRAFGYFTSNRLSGEPRLGALEPARGSFAQYDLGLGLGGALIADRLWFFVAYSPAVEREDVDIPKLGLYGDRLRKDIYAGNLTWKISETSQLLLSVSGDPTVRDAVGSAFGGFGVPTGLVNPDPYLGRLTLGGNGIRLKSTHILQRNLLLDAHLSWMQRNEIFAPATERGAVEPTFIDEQSGLWSGGYPSTVNNTSTVLGGGIKATYTENNHTLKAGLEVKDNRLDASFRVSIIQRFSPFAYNWVQFSSKGTVHNRILSAFVQDSWRADDLWTVNAGIRWDGQYIVASTGRIAQRILDQFQPRVGVIFHPGPRQKIFASYGRFYQDLATYPLTLYYIAGASQQIFAYNRDPRPDPSGGRPIVNMVSDIQPEIDDLKGQHYDECIVGYERQMTQSLTCGVRGVFRTLRTGIEDGEDPPGSRMIWFANPGKAPLGSFPKMQRDYYGLEFTIQKTAGENLALLASYTLSRSTGNYPGLFNADFEYRLPNASESFQHVENLVNGTGLLPNDRTHVLKIAGSYFIEPGLTVGMLFSWQTGTPLSEFGGSRAGGLSYNFIRQRGTAGRTPPVWNVDVRLGYDLPADWVAPLRVQVTVDAFHIGNKRTAVDVEQIHFFNLDANGNQINPNPVYGLPTRFQPPFALRLGVDVQF